LLDPSTISRSGVPGLFQTRQEASTADERVPRTQRRKSHMRYRTAALGGLRYRDATARSIAFERS